MPGIVGIIRAGRTNEKASVLEQMVKCLMHEPFYVSGTYSNSGLGVWIGWVGHAGSFSDCMPVWNETKDVCLIFSGEDFSDTTEIERLIEKGHKCDSKNASYLVHLYEEFGIQFLEKLNGAGEIVPSLQISRISLS